MKTIKKSFAARLEAQVSEAEAQEMPKLAQQLKTVLSKNSVRENDIEYFYSRDALISEIQDNVWASIVRTADFFDCNIDALEVQEIVNSCSNDIIEKIRKHAGIKYCVGAHESQVPGQELVKVAIEVDEDEI